ncbi:MAG: SDR family oxidoreductase [Bacteroidota bacterium]
MKNVIITGSSSGFGFLSAKTLADNGYKVWATMRNVQGKNKIQKEALEHHAASIKVVEMDVANDESVQGAIKAIISEDGKVDVLINNAGIMYIGITEAYSIKQAHQQMNVNFYGIIRTSQAVLPAMRKAGKGLIINCTSTAGRVSWPFMGTYNASKFAVEGYSQALKYELAPTGVEVVLVEPGPFGTNLIGSIAQEDRKVVLEDYRQLKEVQNQMIASFDQFLQSDDAPAPQMVVDAYLILAEMEAGERPTRTQVGISHGVDKINELTQPIQDNVPKELQLGFLLETKV